MEWRLRRQIIIFLLVTGFFSLTAILLYLVYNVKPSCQDGKQNQDELGIDCGGICAKVCLSEVSTPVIWWQQAFRLKDGYYGAAALIENKYDHFGISHLDYLFRFYDENQNLIGMVPGETYVNPNERLVIYAPNVNLKEAVPARTMFEVGTTTWQREKKLRPIQISVAESTFAKLPFPQVRSSLHNDSLETYRDIEVVVVLSDGQRNVIAVSRTFVEVLAPNETKDIFFTWPEQFENQIADPVIDIHPRFNVLKPKAF